MTPALFPLPRRRKPRLAATWTSDRHPFTPDYTDELSCVFCNLPRANIRHRTEPADAGR